MNAIVILIFVEVEMYATTVCFLTHVTVKMDMSTEESTERNVKVNID